MDLPFSTDQFLAVFEQYNLAIWPMQVIAYILGLVAVALAIRPGRYSDRIISGILSVFWLWMGLVYHLMFFRQISAAATAFGILFIVQGALWLYGGIVRPRLSFRAGSDLTSIVGGLFVIYAMVLYPAIGSLLGHGYPRSPAFGVAPCPTTIFTFGLLLWTRASVPKYILAIPLIWSVIGFGAALSLGVREDIGLLIAGLLGTALLARRDRRATVSGALHARYA